VRGRRNLSEAAGSRAGIQLAQRVFTSAMAAECFVEFVGGVQIRPEVASSTVRPENGYRERPFLEQVLGSYYSE
jgi:hypothetical protein